MRSVTPQPGRGDSGASIRRSLVRKTLAAEAERATLAVMLGLCASDVVAIEHLVEQGRLSPSQLGQRLRLSSGGGTVLVQRLERARYVVREANPKDRRSVLVRLSPEMESRLGEVRAPLAERIDELVAGLTDAERKTVDCFVRSVAELSERHAEILALEVSASIPRDREIVVPALWA
jgi:DNA-binding MarR family transcriptional regulator